MARTPTRIRVSPDRQTLTFDFTDGSTRDYRAEFLRVYSPSAEVRGHGDAERKIVGGKRLVEIRDVEMMGSYAIRIGFDDGHDSGIYTWTLFESFDREGESLWQDYLKALAGKGLTRE